MGRSIARLAGLGFAILGAMTNVQAASDVALVDRLRAAGIKAYKAGDYVAYRERLQQLSLLRPNHPDVALRLAAAQARSGRSSEALATIDTIADMGVTVNLEADPRNALDFASLAALPAFAAWQARVAANAEAKLASTVLHSMSDAALLAEDIALDADSGDFYVSSVLEHALLRIDKAGNEHSVPLEAPENRWNVFGVAIDNERHRLWLSAQAVRGFPGIEKGEAGHAQLSVYDLKGGRRIATWAFRPQGNLQAAIGDIAVAPNGDLLVSDGEQGIVTRVDADLRHVRVLARDLVSPQDIAFSEGGRLAFVADYVRGIAVVDLDTGVTHWLTADRGIALIGIDGLYRWRHSLIAVQNGVQPARVVRFTLDDSNKRITGYEVLDRDRATLGDPTHGVIDQDGNFVYLANAGWNHIGDNGKVNEGEALTPAMLRRLRLPQ